jgi:AraC-like DNA-binding protein
VRSVKTIALDLGFQDVSYFCRLFRTHLMGTPNGYRTQVLAGRTASPDSPSGHHSFRGFFRASSQSPVPARQAASLS